MIDEDEFLKENVYYGLTNLSDDFDIPKISYFSNYDFKLIF